MKKTILMLSGLIIVFVCLVSTSWQSIAKEVECISGIEAEYDEGEPYCSPEHPKLCCSSIVIPACVCCPESHSICTPMNYCCDGLACLAEMLYQDNEEVLTLLSKFRDDVLDQSPLGKELIKLYYQWSPVMVEAMQADEEFKQDVRGMVNGVLELIQGEME